MSAYPYSVAVVYREPFGITAFQAATAVIERDDCLEIVHADPDHPDYDLTWVAFPKGTWRECVVTDTADNILFAFTSEPAQAAADALFAQAKAHAEELVAEKTTGRR